MKRAKPLVRVHSIYDHQWSKYPDRIKVPMDDSHVVEYEIVIKMPEPVMRGWLDRFNSVLLCGYKYKNKGIGKRTGRRSEIDESNDVKGQKNI